MDTQNYQYGTIEDVISKMETYADKAVATVDEMNQTKSRLIAAHQWAGGSAQSYDQHLSNINSELGQAHEAVKALAGKVSDGSQAMQDADKKGGGILWK